jgi:hypothetical protein
VGDTDGASKVGVARPPDDATATCAEDPGGVGLDPTRESAGDPAMDQAIVTARTRTSAEAAASMRGQEIRDGIRA